MTHSFLQNPFSLIITAQSVTCLSSNAVCMGFAPTSGKSMTIYKELAPYCRSFMPRMSSFWNQRPAVVFLSLQNHEYMKFGWFIKKNHYPMSFLSSYFSLLFLLFFIFLIVVLTFRFRPSLFTL